jgi:hypothetical protein
MNVSCWKILKHELSGPMHAHQALVCQQIELTEHVYHIAENRREQSMHKPITNQSKPCSTATIVSYWFIKRFLNAI